MTDISNTHGTAAADKPLAGHVALVTGGSRGIGKAIAKKLAQLGSAVGLCAREPQALEAATDEIRSFSSRVFEQIADVTRAAEVSALVRACEQSLGPITILVNNAGIGNPGFGPVHEKSEEDWDRVFDTNLKGVFLVTRAVAPLMIERRRGDIINISSLAGKNTFAGGGLYCASKWGLQGLTGCMAEDLRAYGIRVSVVCPGSVFTEFSGRGPKDPTKVLTPEDVAHAVAMLVLQGPQSFISEVHLRPVTKP
ncbi:MAG TPA: SDR family NAD(P)-dependent oxidoreductase [Candidatus Limnocylindrales bacterium]|nr:SDR family NAD(P)-dependent oxidoreductase [Candidatus Limnocylindrales bacterium]